MTDTRHSTDNDQRHTSLISAVCDGLSGQSCDYEDVAYNAANSDYCSAISEGAGVALQQINAYYAKCPESTVVLSGYSQGASIMSNVLAGDGGDSACPSHGSQNGLTQTSSGVSCNIAAVTLFGSPRHTADQPYNALSGGAGQSSGARDAAGLARLAAYTPRLQDYCNIDDLVCAPGLGADTVEAHTNYFQLYTSQAADHIIGLVQGYSKDKYCPAVSSSSSSMASTTATASASSSDMTSASSSDVASASASASSSAVASESASSIVESSAASEPTEYSPPAYSSAPSYPEESAPAYSTPASVPYITATEVTSIYTTVCPQSSTYNNGNMTLTSTWTGPSTVTSSMRSTTTMTVPGSYKPTADAPKTSQLTTVNGTPAVVQYTHTVTMTQVLNMPTMTITLAVPTATQWIGGQGSYNGSSAATGSGVGAAKPTGSSAPITPYEGAASSSGVAAKWLAIAAGAVGVMMM